MIWPIASIFALMLIAAVASVLIFRPKQGYSSLKAEKKIDVKAKSWMQIRARFEYEAVSSFGNKQPVLYLIDMEPAAEPEDKVVYLG